MYETRGVIGVSDILREILASIGDGDEGLWLNTEYWAKNTLAYSIHREDSERYRVTIVSRDGLALEAVVERTSSGQTRVGELSVYRLEYVKLVDTRRG